MPKKSFLKKLTGIGSDDLSGDEDRVESISSLEDAKDSDEWIEEDYAGQLSVDVYQTDTHVIIKSTIAGVKPEDIDIAIDGDMITIKGKREHEESGISADNYIYQECYWGGFSRSIVLPQEVKPDGINATLKNGVLTVKLPKLKKSKLISVKVKEV